MKDYFDLVGIGARRRDGIHELGQAIAATFARRGTPLPAPMPTGLTAAFSENTQKQQQWNAFVARNRLDAPALDAVVEALAAFVQEPMTHARRTTPARKRVSNFAFLQTELRRPVRRGRQGRNLPSTPTRAPRASTPDGRSSWRCLALQARPGTQAPVPGQPVGALIHEPTFKQAAGEAVFNKARVIDTLGNRAVHSHRPIPATTRSSPCANCSMSATGSRAPTAARSEPAPGLAFDPRRCQERRRRRQADGGAARAARNEPARAGREARCPARRQERAGRRAVRLRDEVAKAKKAAAAQPDTHDYSEAETRDYFIDLLLKEAGWPLDQPRDREFEVAGMPNDAGQGLRRLRAVGRRRQAAGARRSEADHDAIRASGSSRRSSTPTAWRQQFGQRPVIFYSNGYEHWLWDDTNYPPRAVQGFYKKDELELLIQRRTTRKRWRGATINDDDRRALLPDARDPPHRGSVRAATTSARRLVVMATGAGKTRTVIALCDLLMRCNWVKRVLFLADRVALVNQAVNAFKTHLPDASPVNLVTEKDDGGPGVRLDLPDDDGPDRRDAGRAAALRRRALRPGHHRRGAPLGLPEVPRHLRLLRLACWSGLTATPKDEVDRNTYRLFDLERGVPTDAYALDEAVQRRLPRPAEGRVRAAQVPARGHHVRRPVRGREGAVGRAGMGRRRQRPRPASRPRPSTTGCSTRTPSTRCSST